VALVKTAWRKWPACARLEAWSPSHPMADKKSMSEAALGNPPTGESRGDSGKKKYGYRRFYLPGGKTRATSFKFALLPVGFIIP